MGNEHDDRSGLLDGWMTRAELAAALGVTPDTVCRWATEGTGPPYVRIGRKVYYHRDAVRDWIPTRQAG